MVERKFVIKTVRLKLLIKPTKINFLLIQNLCTQRELKKFNLLTAASTDVLI
jgi:hypothetical protein